MVQIKGKVAGVDLVSVPAYLDILVGNDSAFIGHRVYCTKDTANVEIYSTITLHTTTIYKEESQAIYGFGCEEEKSFFDTLLRASGIGGNTSLLIMDSIESVDSLATAILEKDIDYFTSIKGIGEKKATKLIEDLHKRVKQLLKL